MGGMPIRTKLVEYFGRHEGELVSRVMIAKEIEETTTRVRVGMNSLLTSQVPFAENIEVITAGNVWRYNGKTAEKDAETGELFSVIGTLTNGALVLQSTTGKLYRATELT